MTLPESAFSHFLWDYRKGNKVVKSLIPLLLCDLHTIEGRKGVICYMICLEVMCYIFISKSFYYVKLLQLHMNILGCSDRTALWCQELNKASV